MAADPECNQAYQQAKRAAEAAAIALQLSDSPLLKELKDLGGKIPREDADIAAADKSAASEIRREFVRRMKWVEAIATGGKSLHTLAQHARAAADEAENTADALEAAANADPEADAAAAEAEAAAQAEVEARAAEAAAAKARARADAAKEAKKAAQKRADAAAKAEQQAADKATRAKNEAEAKTVTANERTTAAIAKADELGITRWLRRRLGLRQHE